jgi:hypothetical protein
VVEPIPETEIPQKPPAPPVPPSARTPAGAPGTVSDRIAAWLQHPSLPHMQTVVGLLAGILSIGGFAYSYFWATAPVVPTRGDVIAVAVDARTEKTIADATLEVFTLKDALVTTLTPDASGRARHSIKEGSYRLRVTHPRFNTETRTIYVIAGNTADIRVRLTPRPSTSAGAAPTPASPAAGTSGGGASPTKEIGKAVDEGVNAVKKIFR